MLTEEGVTFVETNLKILEKGSEEKEILKKLKIVENRGRYKEH